MHGFDMLPLSHPTGYRQVMFQDYTNIFGRGETCLYLHTSPHKQYYLYIAASIEEWLQETLNKLRNRMNLIQKGNISYFNYVKNMVKDPEYKNGSVTVSSGIEIQAQGKFEMLQSSIYPKNCGVPCEHFFIVKLQIKALEDFKQTRVLKQASLVVSDTTYNIKTKRDEPHKFTLEKKFFDGNPQMQQDVHLKKKNDRYEYNILLYLETLGSKVEGELHYSEILENGQMSEEEKIIKFEPFFLDLPKGQFLVENRMFS